jgi:hypothetical protein
MSSHWRGPYIPPDYDAHEGMGALAWAVGSVIMVLAAFAVWMAVLIVGLA